MTTPCALAIAFCFMVPAHGGAELHSPELHNKDGRMLAAVDMCLINPTDKLIEFGGDAFTTEGISGAAPRELISCLKKSATPCVGDPATECALQY